MRGKLLYYVPWRRRKAVENAKVRRKMLHVARDARQLGLDQFSQLFTTMARYYKEKARDL